MANLAQSPDVDAMSRVFKCDPRNRSLFAPDSEVFDRRWHGYLAANAAVAEPADDDSDEARNAIHAAAEVAELALFATPAMHPHQVLKKFSALEAVLNELAEFGSEPTPRAAIALASFKADLFHALAEPIVTVEPRL